MKIRFFYTVILIAGLVLAGSTVNMSYGQTKQTPTKMKTVQYTCPEHPEIVKDMPGKCPKCGMQLVEKKDMMQMPDSSMMKNNNTKKMHKPADMKKDQMKHDTTLTKPLLK